MNKLSEEQIAEMARGLDHACMAAMELENRKLRKKLDAAMRVINCAHEVVRHPRTWRNLIPRLAALEAEEKSK